MIENVISTLMYDISKKKDKWFLETLEKHNLIKSNDLSNFDFYWLSEEMGVNVVTQDDKTSIYQNEKLLGQWFENFKLKETEDNIYKLETTCWN